MRLLLGINCIDLPSQDLEAQAFEEDIDLEDSKDAAGLLFQREVAVHSRSSQEVVGSSAADNSACGHCRIGRCNAGSPAVCMSAVLLLPPERAVDCWARLAGSGFDSGWG